MWTLLLLACQPDPIPSDPVSLFDPEEWWAGGEGGTNTLLGGSSAFKLPMPALSPEHEQLFYSGNSWFNQSWVQAPASASTRDGLGPLYNATGCSGCHSADGRAAPPDDGLGPFVGLLLRLSTGTGDPEPTYGGQLQDLAIDDVAPDGLARIDLSPLPGRFDDGSPYELLRPTYVLDTLSHGPMVADARISPRIAPQMIGLGLLEAIDAADIEALADPDDVDGDGISGRVQRQIHPLTGEILVGRFGWKGDAPTVEVQAAGAFNGDLGLTSSMFPLDDCTALQLDCLDALPGGDPEVEDLVLERVAVYSRALAVPARRLPDDPLVLEGKGHFLDIGCDGCHVPRHVTGPFPPLPELEGLTIFPYTDLLLHDMGPDLADGRPLGEADGQEWKTPPLWGLGLVPDVNGHSRYLHDGRARDLEEAILWHGGEAETARQAYTSLPVDARDALLTFLADL